MFRSPVAPASDHAYLPMWPPTQCFWTSPRSVPTSWGAGKTRTCGGQCGRAHLASGRKSAGPRRSGLQPQNTLAKVGHKLAKVNSSKFGHGRVEPHFRLTMHQQRSTLVSSGHQTVCLKVFLVCHFHLCLHFPIQWEVLPTRSRKWGSR